MKITLGAALTAAVLATPAYSYYNMENPLYIPMTGELYSKTSLGVSAKKTDDAQIRTFTNSADQSQFPIYKLTEQVGYGITDRLSVNATIAYMYNSDADIDGFSFDRLGLNYRILEDTQKIAWDVYFDMHLDGLTKERSSMNFMFPYQNSLSDGTYGFYLGTKVGHTYCAVTNMIFAEILHHFGNSNNKLHVEYPLSMAFGKDWVSLNTNSRTDFAMGIKSFYDLGPKWSFGGGLTYKYYATTSADGFNDAALSGYEMVLEEPLMFIRDMQNKYSEFIFSGQVTRNLDKDMQVTMYGNYTLPHVTEFSFQGSVYDIELGARFNISF